MLAQTVIPPGCDGLCVFWTSAQQSPNLLQHIGREREMTFRAVGEGTGRTLDLDAFDADYLHLCAWNIDREELVGAYRLRYIDTPRPLPTAAATTDPRALYTHTLFEFDRELIRSLAPAVELGRAFVRQPYQKGYAPLMLLWRGIGRMVAGFGNVRHLFGAASISASHSPAARALMLAYLRRHAFDMHLAPLVAARRPPCERIDTRTEAARLLTSCSDVRALNTAVAALNPCGTPVPVLLRQYLKLDARVLGFNVDPLFHDAIDVLVVVNLDRMPEPMRRRYLDTEPAISWTDCLAHRRSA